MTQEQRPLAPWPPNATPFPASQRDTTGHGPDFPGSAGDREAGKFRPSAFPRLDQVAVTNDDGTPLFGLIPTDLLEQLVMELRAIRIGVQRLVSIEDDNNDIDLLDEAMNETDSSN